MKEKNETAPDKKRMPRESTARRKSALFPNTCEFDNKLAGEFSTAHSDVSPVRRLPGNVHRANPAAGEKYFVSFATSLVKASDDARSRVF